MLVDVNKRRKKIVEKTGRRKEKEKEKTFSNQFVEMNRTRERSKVRNSWLNKTERERKENAKTVS
jgi:hypothetical protein